jgi:glycosyltransferase involved in cell wall biosynthesis
LEVAGLIRFLTEYSGLGGSTRMIVHLAGLLAESYGTGVEIHYREHGDPFLEDYFRLRFAGIPGSSIVPHGSAEEAIERLCGEPGSVQLVAHLPYSGCPESYQRLRSCCGRLVQWNLEVPSRHAYGDVYPEWMTVVYLNRRQVPEETGNMVRIPAPFEPIEWRGDSGGGTVGMVSAWARDKGIFESFAGFRASHARRLRFWTRTNLRRKVRLWVRDRRFRVHRPVVDLSQMYSGFDCLLHLQPHSMGESNVIRDCLSVGTPCVLSEIEGHRVYADLPGVNLVDREDPAKVGEAIDRALDLDVRAELREAFRPRLPDNGEIVRRWGEVLGL